MDEATNALDDLTERSVMNSVLELKNTKTIILITHRLSSVKNCDNIILIEKGKITHQENLNNCLRIANFLKRRINQIVFKY